MQAGNEVLVKATPLRTLRAFMDEHLSETARARVMERVSVEYPAETAKVRERASMASERVPVMFVNRLIELTAEELHEPAPRVAHRVGRLAAEEASNGVMRLAMTFLSIPNLLRKLPPVWSQLYSHGSMHFESGPGNVATMELTEYPLVSATGCARITGWLEWFAQRAEKSAVIAHKECRAEGGKTCRWDLRW